VGSAHTLGSVYRSLGISSDSVHILGANNRIAACILSWLITLVIAYELLQIYLNKLEKWKCCRTHHSTHDMGRGFVRANGNSSAMTLFQGRFPFMGTEIELSNLSSFRAQGNRM